MQRKIFVAINFDGSTKKYIHRKLNPLIKTINAKWVPSENYHLTLSFLGYQNDNTLINICALLSKSLAGENIFDITFDSFAWGPDSVRKKMIWLQGPRNNCLSEIRKLVEETISSMETDAKQFRPHVTLARLQKKRVQSTETIIDLSSIDIRAVIPVYSIDVMESIFENGKKTYQTLDSIELV
ncbi:MAG: RNA 2',3'-cyclic phosphodiesterase [Patescibacteria group bacterium]|nr:RNA 2',3'-cyclic phosphodiesterase [Patescibacteria group bacterium]